MKIISYIRLLFRTVFLISGVLFTVTSLPGCADDNLVLEDPAQQGETRGEDAIAFTLELDKSMSTPAGSGLSGGVEAKDDWIDMQDKFRVFFFTEHGDFLFGANDRITGSISNVPGKETQKDYWYVRVPMTRLVDRNNKEYDIDKIKSYLKNHKFKVAVLANWPNAGDKINPSDYDDNENNNFKQNPSSILKGEPLWGWENSVLNVETTADKIRNINDLHHVYNDTYYDNDYEINGKFSRKAIYEPFMEYYVDNDGKRYRGMGQPTDWVKMRDIAEGWKDTDHSVPSEGFESNEEANRWIRAYWDPTENKNEDKKIYRHYQHLWFLWNFNAIYATGKAGVNFESTSRSNFANNFGWNDGGTMGTGGTNNPWGWEWWQRNGIELYDNWMKGKETNLDNKELHRGRANNTAYLTFKKSTAVPTQLVTIKSATSGSNVYGVKLAKIQNPNPTTGMARTNGESGGYFKFTARTSGTLRIRWGSANDQAAHITVQRNSAIDREYTVAAGNANKTFNINGTDGGEEYRDININSNSEDVYIWSSDGNAVIYGIEFIRGTYLYETDRINVAPNEDQGIPMYGVLDHEAIPTWEYGTTYNLEQNVPLIRALAKIVVYIPAGFGEPKHVYMRFMNRVARCEPMDVETETYKLWDENNLGHKTDGTTTYCEWQNLMNYGPVYQRFGNSEPGISEYQKYLSWFYGSWKDTEWKFEREIPNNPEHNHWVRKGDVTGNAGWNFNEATGLPIDDGFSGSLNVNDRNDKYPHLFNPYINRSSFCHFLKAGTDDTGTLNKYVLYMPDKYIDDPHYPGEFTSIPRVAHIEFRFPPKDEGPSAAAAEYNNDEFNLDDNNCYRIYFTNYGYDSNFTAQSNTPENTEIRSYSMESFDEYERSNEHLKKHWPVMRNHIYTFYVSTSGPETPNIKVIVSDWKHEKVVVKW